MPIAIDPLSSAALGTDLADCSLITNIFERGAHSTPSEAAVFATLNRSLENSKLISEAMVSSLTSYLKTPQQNTVTSQGATFGDTSGTSAALSDTLQGLGLGGENGAATFNSSSFGDVLLDKMKECIPCLDRITAFLEIHPNVNLLAALELDILARLSFLTDLGNFLKDFDIYGDLCELLNLLSFMCIPDLQRIIAMLMALLILDIPKFDGIIGLLQGLILPIFAPFLSAITSLLDQFSLTVMSPLDCIIDAINQQAEKFGYALDPNSPLHQLKNGITELNAMIVEAKETMKQKIEYYINNIKAILAELGGGDTAYLLLSIKKLKILRLVSFITAIILALSKGSLACSDKGKPPEQSEVDNFLKTYLNPNSSFDIWLDDNGKIHVDEKVPGQTEALKTFNNVFSFEGEDFIDPNTTDTSDPVLAQVVDNAISALTPSSDIIIPCRFATTTQDETEKVNRWMDELNKL